MRLLKGVNSYIQGGKRYNYYRKTGQRLPDLPHDHPDFVTAVANAARQSRIQSRAPVRKTEVDILKVPQDAPEMIKPDFVVHNVTQCASFVLSAKPKQVLLYHSGDLSQDGAVDLLARDKAQYVRLAASLNLLVLRQQRVSQGWTYYYASRTDSSLRGCPLHVLRCDITPDEYMGLTAVNERQSSQATTRAIRDELGISDQEASDMRRSFIERGWMDNGRPPELTDLGLELLS